MRGAVVAVLVVGVAAACSGGSSRQPSGRTPPDLAGFLRQPVATPTSCPPSVSGSTSGRRSPWVGHVDVSVFVAAAASPATVRRLAVAIEALPQVARVYAETKEQAWQEFRRLYTCSAQVPRAQVPASFRIRLRPVDRSTRDAVVRTLARLPGVDSVSCDPSAPCTGAVVPTPTPASTPTSAAR